MKRQKIISFLLVTLLLFVTGCQDQAMVAPKLKEGRGNSEYTMTLKYGDICDVGSGYGVINGTRECAKAQNSGTIEELKVRAGDTVKKGDVIAVLATEDLLKEKNSFVEQENEQQRSHSNQLKQYAVQMQKLQAEYEHQQEVASMDATEKRDALKLLQAQMTKVTHDISYENDSYKMQQQELETQKSRVEKSIEDNVIKAPCSGLFAGYPNDLSIGAAVEQNQAVGVIYNEQKKVVYVTEQEDVGTFQDVNQLQFRIADQQYTLKEYSYSAKEQLALSKLELDSVTCFTFEGIDSYQIGDMGLLSYVKNERKHVLSVPTDAVKTDGSKSFVYVVKGNTKKKTEVKTGVRTANAIEITAGLSESDTICYTSYKGKTADESLVVDESVEEGVTINKKDAVVKKSDVYYEDFLSNYDEIGYDGVYPKSSYQALVTDPEEGGVLTSYHVKEGQKVKKGAVVATVSHEVKDSEMTEQINAVADARAQIKKEQQEYEASLKELTIQKMKETASYEQRQIDFDIALLKLTHERSKEELSYSLKQANEMLQELRERKATSILAPCDGTVSSLGSYQPGNEISPEKELLVIEATEQNVLSRDGWGGYFFPGQKVEFLLSDGSKQSGMVSYSGVELYRRNAQSENNTEVENLYRISFRLDQPLKKGIAIVDVRSRFLIARNQLTVSSEALKYDFITQLGMDDSDNYTVTNSVNKKVSEDHYESTDVSILNSSRSDDAIVISGLEENDVIGYLSYDYGGDSSYDTYRKLWKEADQKQK